jgi:hypothetical protein
MIIGIGGRMGSGKNLVCNIIQYLTSEDVSPECIKRIKEGLPIEGYHNSKFEQKAFAGKLKQTASLLTGIPVESFEDQEFKKALLGAEWGTVRTNPLNAIPVFGDVQFNELMSVREFLQRLGTEAMRDGLHTNVWVNALFADYKAEESWLNVQLSEKPELVYPNWIITDMRFPNELDTVKEKEGITIRVVRPHGYTNPHTGEYKEMPLSYHPSETALDDSVFDYEIINDAGIPELIEKVREILITEKII